MITLYFYLIVAVPVGIFVYQLAKLLSLYSPSWPDRIPDTKKFAWAERLDNNRNLDRWLGIRND